MTKIFPLDFYCEVPALLQSRNTCSSFLFSFSPDGSWLKISSSMHLAQHLHLIVCEFSRWTIFLRWPPWGDLVTDTLYECNCLVSVCDTSRSAGINESVKWPLHLYNPLYIYTKSNIYQKHPHKGPERLKFLPLQEDREGIFFNLTICWNQLEKPSFFFH